MKKAITLTIKILIALLILFCVAIAITFSYMDLHFPVINSNELIQEKALLPWDNDRNFVQTGNTCGGHALMAFLYSYRGEKRNPYYLYEKINEKDQIGYIYFWGITRYMHKNGLKGKSYYMNLYSRAAKEAWIKGKIANKLPVMLIIQNGKALHYITLLGYSESEFFIYDSLQKRDQNEEMPGNMTIRISDVLNKWEKASYKGIKINIATTL
jgi:hypothetical protein